MDPSVIARVAASYTGFSSRLDELADAFFRRLLRDHPWARHLSAEELERQRRHLAGSLALVCKNLSRLELLEEPLMSLGAAYRRAGATPAHYPAVRDTFLDALDEISPEPLTHQLRRDWAAALNAVAAIMLRGAAPPVTTTLPIRRVERQHPP